MGLDRTANLLYPAPFFFGTTTISYLKSVTMWWVRFGAHLSSSRALCLVSLEYIRLYRPKSYIPPRLLGFLLLLVHSLQNPWLRNNKLGGGHTQFK
jgi:hypothetical protein